MGHLEENETKVETVMVPTETILGGFGQALLSTVEHRGCRKTAIDQKRPRVI